MTNQPPKKHNLPGTLTVGSIIGGTYRVIDFVGAGGMGYVYKVEHLMMAKVMAPKVLRADEVSPAVWSRFRIEAKAIARLDHPNVVRIYDMNQTEEGTPYYTMDLLAGQSLADYLDANGPMRRRWPCRFLLRFVSGWHTHTSAVSFTAILSLAILC